MRRGKRGLTKKGIDALKKPGGHGDRDLPGFSVRLLPSGTKVFGVRYVVKAVSYTHLTLPTSDLV